MERTTPPPTARDPIPNMESINPKHQSIKVNLEGVSQVDRLLEKGTYGTMEMLAVHEHRNSLAVAV